MAESGGREGNPGESYVVVAFEDGAVTYEQVPEGVELVVVNYDVLDRPTELYDREDIRPFEACGGCTYARGLHPGDGRCVVASASAGGCEGFRPTGETVDGRLLGEWEGRTHG